MKYNDLTVQEKDVIENKGTEAPFSGEYDNFYKAGTFICRRCNNPLFSSKAKFDAHCGWPAFDESFPDAMKRIEDDSLFMKRVEIECANCSAHLGHEFTGEGFESPNKTDTRECVNSLSIKFIPDGEELPAKIAPEALEISTAT